MFYSFVRSSKNRKTGPIPICSAARETCPSNCPFKRIPNSTAKSGFTYNGCYADHLMVTHTWNKLSHKGLTIAELCEQIRRLPKRQLWRYGVMGDLPGMDNAIDAIAVDMLIAANKGRRGFGYTHKPLTHTNKLIIRDANLRGFRINLSANSLEHADTLANAMVGPVVTVLPSDWKRRSFQTSQGRRGIVCPAYTRDDMTCGRCGLCAMETRAIIGFPAHGSSKKKVDAVFCEN